MTPLSQGDSLAFTELDATPSSAYQLSKSFYLKDAWLPHLKLPLLEGSSWTQILYCLLAGHSDLAIYSSTRLCSIIRPVVGSAWHPMAPCATKDTGSGETWSLPREKTKAVITWWAVEVQSMEQTLKVEPGCLSMCQCKWYFPGRHASFSLPLLFYEL